LGGAKAIKDSGYAANSWSNLAGSNNVPSASVTPTFHPSLDHTRALAAAMSKLALSVVTVLPSFSATILYDTVTNSDDHDLSSVVRR
jgi:hypothetical protein